MASALMVIGVCVIPPTIITLQSEFSDFMQHSSISAIPEHILKYQNIVCICFYRPQTKFVKVMFLHLSVSHSVQGGTRAGTHPGQVHPREQCRLGDTGNKPAVRILLECILVYIDNCTLFVFR